MYVPIRPRRYILAALAGALCFHFSLYVDSYRQDFHHIHQSSWEYLAQLANKMLPTRHVKEEYLALCIATRDEYDNLPEFLIHHYTHMNVSHFYISDDGSKPPLSTFYNYGIPRSALTFDYFDANFGLKFEPGQFQMWQYQECARKYGNKHKWMGFIDVDEFLAINTNETFEGILRGLDTKPDIGSLSINWQSHTSAGLIDRPESVRKSFLECIDESVDNERDSKQIDRHVKSFAKTALFGSFNNNPHILNLKDNAKTVGEDEEEFLPGFAWRKPITRERLTLHHYAVKSKSEFEEKLRKWPHRKQSFWDMIHEGNSTDCQNMLRYSP